MEATNWIAIYAAIVSTGALALEIRRWFESGPKIYVSSNPDMTIVGNNNSDVERGVLLVRAYNRGDMSTTITNMVIYKYNNIISRFCDKPDETYIVPNPQVSGIPIIPHELKSGTQWMGVARHRPDVISDLRTGKYWAGVITTNRSRPYLNRIPKRRDNDGVPADAKSL